MSHDLEKQTGTGTMSGRLPASRHQLNEHTHKERPGLRASIDTYWLGHLRQIISPSYTSSLNGNSHSCLVESCKDLNKVLKNLIDHWCLGKAKEIATVPTATSRQTQSLYPFWCKRSFCHEKQKAFCSTGEATHTKIKAKRMKERGLWPNHTAAEAVTPAFRSVQTRTEHKGAERVKKKPALHSSEWGGMAYA